MGRPQNCSDCCCYCTRQMIGSANIPETWELAVAGVTDDDCTECDRIYNGTFCLDQRPYFGMCRYQSPSVCPCDSPQHEISKVEVNIPGPASPGIALELYTCDDTSPLASFGTGWDGCTNYSASNPTVHLLNVCAFGSAVATFNPVGAATGTGSYPAGCPVCPDGAWEAEITGVINTGLPGGCETCTEYNRTYSYVFSEISGKPSCIYINSDDSPCADDSESGWELVFDSGSNLWYLRAIPENAGTSNPTGYPAVYCLPRYGTGGNYFDFCGPNTFELISQSNFCATWPATLTIEPDVC